jgi:hypothetical protein
MFWSHEVVMKRIVDRPPGSPDALKCELAGEVLRSAGRLRLGVSGWSMLPAFWPKDTLVIERANCDEVCVGDVVLFRRGHRVVVHRVIGKAGEASNQTVRTQGDGMPYADDPVNSSDLMGRVSLILRRGRSFQPGRSLNLPERIAAALVRRSYWAGRILTELQLMREQERPLPCQN